MNMRQALCIAQTYGIYGDYTQRKADEMLSRAVEWDEKRKALTHIEAKAMALRVADHSLEVAEAVQFIVNTQARP